MGNKQMNNIKNRQTVGYSSDNDEEDIKFKKKIQINKNISDINYSQNLDLSTTNTIKNKKKNNHKKEKQNNEMKLLVENPSVNHPKNNNGDLISSNNNNKLKKKTSKIKKSRQYTIFTLGINGAGKSTFIKQAKIIYNDGFTEDERLSHKNILISNIIFGMKEIINIIEKEDISNLNESSLKKIRYIKEMTDDIDIYNNFEWKEKIEFLWNTEPIFKNIWKVNINNPLISSMDYHINHLNSYCDINYLPTNNDILRARQRTTGEVNTIININKSVWNIIDVGGQSTEREKWEMIIDNKNNENNVKVILFFVSLIDFDIPCPNDKSITNMKLTEKVFLDILNITKNKGNFNIIVCLNKLDLFKEKITNPIYYNKFKKEFPDYNNNNNNNNVEIDSLLKYIGERFQKIACNITNNDRNYESTIFVTCGIDTDLISITFKGISDLLFARNLSNLDYF